MKFHDTLNDKIWENEQLKPEVSMKLHEIADAFIEFLELSEDAVVDVVLTGSMCSYNYTQYSDIDLHLKVDFDKVHEDCPIVKGYLWQAKSSFNKNHDISIYGIPVEVYAEGTEEDTVHNGLYSLWDNEWIDFPKKIPPTDNDAAVESKFQEFKDMADNIDDSEVAEEIINKLYAMRKAGLEEVGEFSTENLAFKKVRDAGILDKLKQLKQAHIDKQLSLESYNESISESIEWNFNSLEQLFKQINKLNTEKSYYDSNAPKNGSEWSTRTIVSKYNEQISKSTKQLANKYYKQLIQKYPEIEKMTNDHGEPFDTFVGMTQWLLGFGTDSCGVYGILTNNSRIESRFKWEFGKELGFEKIDYTRNKNNSLYPYEQATLYKNKDILCIVCSKDWASGGRYGVFFFDTNLLYSLKEQIDKQLPLESYNESSKEYKLKNKNESINDEKKMQIEFVGVDEWNRPTFKSLDKDKTYYLTDTYHLFDEDVTAQQIKQFYSNQLHPLNHYLVYKGKSFDSEPMGTEIKRDLEIVVDAKNESIKEDLEDSIFTLPIKDKFIEYVDVHELGTNLVDVQFVAKGKDGATMPIYVANGILDVEDGTWNKYPEVKYNIYHLRDKDISSYILDEFAEFKNKRSNLIEDIGDKVLEKYVSCYHEDSFAKLESILNEAEGIYKPNLILQAYKKQQDWLKYNNYKIGETPDIQLFNIENDEIVGCNYIPRKDVYTYKPEDNEYYLDMIRDSGDVLTDYNLEPAQKLVDRWNESRYWS